MVLSKPISQSSVIFDADIVWAASAAAYRENGFSYQKYTNEEYTANRVLISNYLKGGSPAVTVTDSDRAEGSAMRQHFRGYLFKQLASKITDFQNSIMREANRDSFSETSQFGLIAYAAEQYRRDIAARSLEESIQNSSAKPVKIGDRVECTVRVLQSIYSINYGCYFVVAQWDESIVQFAQRQGFAVNEIVKIKGRVKAQRVDGVIRLNYVKIKEK